MAHYLQCLRIKIEAIPRNVQDAQFPPARTRVDCKVASEGEKRPKSFDPISLYRLSANKFRGQFDQVTLWACS